MPPSPFGRTSSSTPHEVDWRDGVGLLLAKSVVCVTAAWTLVKQPTLCFASLLAAAFFLTLALLGARRWRNGPQGALRVSV